MERLVEGAIVDAYGESEQRTAFLTMLEDNLELPFLPLLDVQLPNPPPAGAEWVEAYRRWTRSV